MKFFTYERTPLLLLLLLLVRLSAPHGADCSKKTCPKKCSGRGRCVSAGKCVCDRGFTGPDCSDKACPKNCNNRGRCVHGACICADGFGGPDCLDRTCPNNCSGRGACVGGRCVCGDDFFGNDCSEKSCPGDCSSRGRCVDGQCVCGDGFGGEDCSETTCPGDCSSRGRCVDGQCVCDGGFTGADCSTHVCPNDCKDRGRCIKGRCVCRSGFTGLDCSRCVDGRTGPHCDTGESSAPPHLLQSATHFWTQLCQSGRAADLSVSVSEHFICGLWSELKSLIFLSPPTAISPPSNLHVVKTTSTTAVAQWEESQGEIDRYRLTVTPNDGTGQSQNITVPAGQNSAHIRQLEAGHMYDIILVAEKDDEKSEAASSQTVPGEFKEKVSDLW
uniref:Tenascin XB n=1 Tax=Cynoglossus semilaevis TaxID=244447 RepID=A0A3P8WVS6_CYNSE